MDFGGAGGGGESDSASSAAQSGNVFGSTGGLSEQTVTLIAVGLFAVIALVGLFVALKK
jgi:hypothetical protein